VKPEKSVKFKEPEKKGVKFDIDSEDEEEEEEEVATDDQSEEEIEPVIEDEEEATGNTTEENDTNGEEGKEGEFIPRRKKVEVFERRGNIQGPLCIIKPAKRIKNRKTKGENEEEKAAKRQLGKRKAKDDLDGAWDCPECTYKNNPEDFKCEMCFANKLTAKGRKAKRDPSSVEERVTQASLEEDDKKTTPTMAYVRPNFLANKAVYKEDSPPPQTKPQRAFKSSAKLLKYEKLYDCDLCNYQATQPGSLKRHKLAIHDGIRYACDNCEYSSSQRSSLKQHKLTAHEGVTYACDQCEYQASQPGTLKRHRQTQHEGIKAPNVNKMYGITFDCEECDYRASQRSSLNRHKLAKHEGAKYNCDECDYQGTTPQNLRLHIKCKHEGVRYPCDMCSYEATQAGSLNRHRQNKHSLF